MTALIIFALIAFFSTLSFIFTLWFTLSVVKKLKRIEQILRAGLAETNPDHLLLKPTSPTVVIGDTVYARPGVSLNNL